MLRLRFDKSKIGYWAGRYDDGGNKLKLIEIETEVAPRIVEAGLVTKPDFVTLCVWKSPRIRRHAERNAEGFIEAVTRTALATTNEQLRIECLTLLHGVGYPVASVILHFGSRDPYPIIDFRTLWSSNADVPGQYDFNFWWKYVTFCRKLADRSGVDMRTLDHALWQSSKERQK